MSDQRVAIVGVGYSTVARRSDFSYLDLSVQAALAALADAGMERADVDAVVCRPRGDGEDKVLTAPGLAHALGIGPLDYYSTPPLNYGDMIAAAVAGIGSGLCRTCVCVHPLKVQWSASIRPEWSTNEYKHGATLDNQFEAPIGLLRGIQHAGGMPMQRYMSLYGATESQFGAQQVAQRSHAALHDDAFFREPMTIEDYLAAPYISKPIRIFDCDMPCDVAGAVILTSAERAADCAKPPAYLESFAIADTRARWDDLDNWAAWHCAKTLWSRTSYRPSDVQCAQLYDGYSIVTMLWLEALGFCGRGEAASFAAEGNTRLGGALPVNTDGGVANVGRRHGASHVIEAVRQVRGEAGRRQVPGAHASIFSIAGGFWATAGLVTAQ